MKQNRLIYLAILSLVMIGCTQDEPMSTQIAIPSKINKAADETFHLQRIAQEIANSDITISDMQYVSQGISLAVENGLDEIFYAKELLNEDSKIVPMSQHMKGVHFIEVFRTLQNTDFYKLSNNSNRLMLYWPFHENWDGVSKPVISFTPLNHSQQHNIAYYLENGELKTIDVDFDYIKNNPVWIVCLSPITYNQLPDFNNPNRRNIGETLNIVSRKIVVSEKYNRKDNIQAKGHVGGYLEFEYLEAKGSRFFIFVGNSITFKIYREFLLNGVLQECDCIICNLLGNGHVENPVIVTFTANEYNNGAIRYFANIDEDKKVILSTFDTTRHDLRFCITSISDLGGSIINPPTYPINPLSFNISNQENIIVDKRYDKNYFNIGNNLDSIQYIKWNILYSIQSGM